MGIEAIGSIGSAVGSVASAVGSIGRIVNEGPVALADLKNTMPLQIGKSNPISEIVFAPSKPLVIQQAEEVAAAAWGKSKLPTAAQAISQTETIIAQAATVPNVIPAWAPDHLTHPEAVVTPQVEPAVTPWVLSGVEPTVEAQPKLQPAQATLPAVSPVLEEQEVEKVVMERVKTKDPKERLEEEEVMEKRIYLKDEKALAQRIYEIRLAFKKAEMEARKLGLGERIAGSLVARFMPLEHAGNRSSIVQPNGPDGSYEETIEAVKAGQFDSEDQVENVAVTNIPVKKGKDGQPVKSEAVWKVLKHWTVKPTTVHEIVTRRIVKKALAAPHQTVSTPLKDFPQLTAVFPKAV